MASAKRTVDFPAWGCLKYSIIHVHLYSFKPLSTWIQLGSLYAPTMIVKRFTGFEKLLRERSPIASLSRQWYTSCEEELLESVNRQCRGLQTCLVALINATNSEYNDNNITKLFLHVGRGHSVLNTFCDRTINLRRIFPHSSLEGTQMYQRVNLYAIEILELVYQFKQVKEYFTHRRKTMVIFLRIVFKIRIKLEKYLVHVNYWNH